MHLLNSLALCNADVKSNKLKGRNMFLWHYDYTYKDITYNNITYNGIT